MKTIGIVLLWILKGTLFLAGLALALVLLLLLLVLFVPVRYRVEGTYRDTHRAYLRASWLLHLFRVEIVLPGEEGSFGLSYRILGFRVKPGAKDKKNAETGKKAGKKKAGKKKAEVPLEPEKNEETVLPPEPEEQAAEEPKESKEPKEPVRPAARERKKSLSGIIKKIRDGFTRVTQTLRRTVSSAEKLRNTAEKWIHRVVDYPGRDALLRLFTGELGYIFTKLRPKRLTLDLAFGFDDPSLTGRCMAAYGMLSGMVLADGKNVRVDIEPDFENKRLEADLTAVGRIRLFTLVRVVIHLFRSQELRGLIRDIRGR